MYDWIQITTRLPTGSILIRYELRLDTLGNHDKHYQLDSHPIKSQFAIGWINIDLYLIGDESHLLFWRSLCDSGYDAEAERYARPVLTTCGRPHFCFFHPTHPTCGRKNTRSQTKAPRLLLVVERFYGTTHESRSFWFSTKIKMWLSRNIPRRVPPSSCVITCCDRVIQYRATRSRTLEFKG